MNDQPRKLRKKAGHGPYKWLSIAYDVPVKPTGRKFVLVCITAHADEDGYARPSRALLCAETGQSRNTIDGHIQALEAAGLLTVTKARDKAGQWDDSAYILDWDAMVRAGLAGVDPCTKTGHGGARASGEAQGTDHAQKPGTVHAQEPGTDHAQFSPPPCTVSGNPPIPPYTDEGSSEDKAPSPGGDPDGPPGDAPGEGETTLAAEWRTLLPRVVHALREPAFIVEAKLRDAFVVARREGDWQQMTPDGTRTLGQPRPAVFLEMAVVDGHAASLINGPWRAEIHKATGYVLVAKVDSRAMGARARRQEREKAEVEAAKFAAKRNGRRRA